MVFIYGPDTTTVNYALFCFRRFYSRIFDVKYASRTDMPVAGDVNKIAEIIEDDGHVSNRSIAQKLKIDN